MLLTMLVLRYNADEHDKLHDMVEELEEAVMSVKREQDYMLIRERVHRSSLCFFLCVCVCFALALAAFFFFHLLTYAHAQTHTHTLTHSHTLLDSLTPSLLRSLLDSLTHTLCLCLRVQSMTAQTLGLCGGRFLRRL